MWLSITFHFFLFKLWRFQTFQALKILILRAIVRKLQTFKNNLKNKTILRRRSLLNTSPYLDLYVYYFVDLLVCIREKWTGFYSEECSKKIWTTAKVKSLNYKGTGYILKKLKRLQNYIGTYTIWWRYWYLWFVNTTQLSNNFAFQCCCIICPKLLETEVFAEYQNLKQC